jgi:hypothetical protein
VDKKKYNKDFIIWLKRFYPLVSRLVNTVDSR